VDWPLAHVSAVVPGPTTEVVADVPEVVLVTELVVVTTVVVG
jgi:hypothetical protein